MARLSLALKSRAFLGSQRLPAGEEPITLLVGKLGEPVQDCGLPDRTEIACGQDRGQ